MSGLAASLDPWVPARRTAPAAQTSPYRDLVPDRLENDPTMATRARQRHQRRAAGGVPRLPWRRIVNPYTPLEILSADQVEAIHVASLTILRDIGMEVLGGRALDLFEGAGAGVAREGGARGPAGRVRFDPAQVEELVALAPSRFELHARNPERGLVFGDRHVVFGAVGGPAFVTDLDRGRRAGNAADMDAYVRVIGSLDILHQEGGGPLEPTDLPVETRHLDMYRTFATLLDKPWQCLAFGSAVVDDAIEVACISRGIDRSMIVDPPSLMTIVNSNSPLRLDGPCPMASSRWQPGASRSWRRRSPSPAR
jgi:trimethylamine--corrinoid protein Co-methyltransferase